MSNTVTSPNMSLPVPVVGVDPGPDWATQLNNCLALIDQHNHSTGQGVQIGPAGLNINADLSIGSNNLTLVRSTRYAGQSGTLTGASDLGCSYVAGVDLYFNDLSGNKIRITQSGGVAGSPGSIASLTSPASATYVSGTSTFVWQSAASTPANLDAAAVIFRNLSANSKGLTLSPPAAMGADYSLVLPSVPGSTLPVILDNVGNLGTAQITSAQIANAAVTTTQIASQTIAQGNLALRTTGTTVGAGGVALSASSAAFSTTSNSPTSVTNLSVTITTTGRPVFVGLVADGSVGNQSSIGCSNSGSAVTFVRSFFDILNGATTILEYILSTGGASSTDLQIFVPSSALSTISFPSAGTYTFSVKIYSNTVTQTSLVTYSKLIAYEI